jgi:hypothetical protein
MFLGLTRKYEAGELSAAGVGVSARAHVTGNGNTACKASLNPPENIFIYVIQIFGSEGGESEPYS